MDGSLQKLIELAIEEESLTAPEIADILEIEELPVEYEHEWSIGE